MDQQDKMRQLLAQLWQQHFPAIIERVQILSAAVEAAREGKLTPSLRTEAESAAHKLAGVLGTFGREEGTNLARTIEKLLSEPELPPSKITQLESVFSELQKQISL